MKLVLVGGHSRNVGKTSIVEGIIDALSDKRWTAVKITQFGNSVCAADRESCGCETADHSFAITEESEKGGGTDTSRFLKAGAKRALWVRVREGELVNAIPSFKKEIEDAEFVIAESNSLRRFLIPTLYIQALDPLNPDFKISAQQFFDLADAYILAASSDDALTLARSAWENISLEREIQKNKPYFFVRPEERYINSSVIEFVRARL